MGSKEQGAKTAGWWTMTTAQGNTSTFGVCFFNVIV